MNVKAKKSQAKSVKVKPLEVDLSDVVVNGTVDKTGIHLTTTYQGHHLHYLILHTNEFNSWQSMKPIQRAELIP